MDKKQKIRFIKRVVRITIENKVRLNCLDIAIALTKKIGQARTITNHLKNYTFVTAYIKNILDDSATQNNTTVLSEKTFE